MRAAPSAFPLRQPSPPPPFPAPGPLTCRPARPVSAGGRLVGAGCGERGCRTLSSDSPVISRPVLRARAWPWEPLELRARGHPAPESSTGPCKGSSIPVKLVVAPEAVTRQVSFPLLCKGAWTARPRRGEARPAAGLQVGCVCRVRPCCAREPVWTARPRRGEARPPRAFKWAARCVSRWARAAGPQSAYTAIRRGLVDIRLPFGALQTFDTQLSFGAQQT